MAANAGFRSLRGLKPVVEPGTLLQGRWRVSRDEPLHDDEVSTILKVRDIKTSKDLCMKLYRSTDPYTVQKFRRSVEVLLTFRGRFTSAGCRVEGSSNLDLILEELRAHSSFAEYATGQSFLTHMDFRHVFPDIVSFSHDKEWMPALDANSGLFFIVMELAECSLRDKLTEHIAQKTCLVAEEINSIQWSLISMVCGLMSEGFLHLDIKPTTVFRFKDERGKEKWKLVDLDGVAMCGSSMRFQDVNYTVEYAPPELARLLLARQREGGRLQLARTMNVWSIGMVLMEVAALMPVYGAKYSWYQKWKEDTKQVGRFLATVAGDRPGLGMENMVSEELHESLNWVSPDLTALLEGMLVKDEKKRVTITQCLLHKWFAPRRKAVHDARWGVPPENEGEARTAEEGKGLVQGEQVEPGRQDTTKQTHRANAGLDSLPSLETNEQMRMYIRAQVEKREYRPGEVTALPSGLPGSLGLATAAQGEPAPKGPAALTDHPDSAKQAGASKACTLM